MLTGLGVVGFPVDNANPSVIDTGFGTSANCANFGSWLLNSGCWKYSPSAWDEMSGFNPPPQPTAPPAVDAGTSSTPAPYATTANFNAAVDAAISQGRLLTGQALQFWAGNQPTVNPSAGPSVPWLLIGVVAAFGLWMVKR